MKPSGFRTNAAAALEDSVLQRALDRATRRQDTGRRERLAEMPDALRLRQLASQVRDRTLAGLDGYLAQLADNIEARGGHVHWAADHQQACDIVTDIAEHAGAKSIVKGKSMLTEEIELNAALTQAGAEVIETDLGEYIIQLLGHKPSHIVGPAVHLTAPQIAALFVDKLGIAYTEDPTALTRAARRVLREKFRNADMGISGGNIAVADPGAVCIVTNEGNGRMVTSCPPVYVAVVGIEKVVPTMADLAVLLKVLARSATGQRSTVYTNLTFGPRHDGATDGPREFHLVLVDAKRTDILAGSYPESLKCIRCGACLNACPVYRKVGGHAYDSIYPGPIGKLLTPQFESLAARAELPHASSLCGACYEACPVMINIPDLLIQMRRRQRFPDWPAWMQRLGVKLWAWGMTAPWRYRMMGWLFRSFVDVGGKDGWHRNLFGPGANWTDKRDFPTMADKPFHKLWATIEREGRQP